MLYLFVFALTGGVFLFHSLVRRRPWWTMRLVYLLALLLLVREIAISLYAVWLTRFSVGALALGNEFTRGVVDTQDYYLTTAPYFIVAVFCVVLLMRSAARRRLIDQSPKIGDDHVADHKSVQSSPTI